jgi:2-polyprenyl-3-methyl-5-hydroxy-6-metoxy-1,4-benzoquinol methylase
MTTTIHEKWPAESLEEVDHCPVCGSNMRTRLYHNLTDRSERVAPGKWTMYQCAGCGSAYLDPRPDLASVGRAYRTYHTHVDLLNGYLNRRFGYELRPAARVGRLLVAVFPGAAGVAWRDVRCLPRPLPSGRLLDIGCGNGSFLLRMREAGWEVEGIDPDPISVGLARNAGLDVTEGILSEETAASGRYDAVTLSHVIEHVHDPKGVLSECLRVLRPGGTLWIATPNIEASGRRRFGSNWFPLDPPRHLVLFSRSALEHALREVGFIVDHRPPPTPDAVLWSDRASHALTVGRNPYEPPRAPKRLRAIAADARTFVRRHHEEQIDLVARRPG